MLVRLHACAIACADICQFQLLVFAFGACMICSCDFARQDLSVLLCNMRTGVVVVVEPLLSLMHDQVSRLPAALPGAMLQGSMGRDEVMKVSRCSAAGMFRDRMIAVWLVTAAACQPAVAWKACGCGCDNTEVQLQRKKCLIAIDNTAP